MISASSMLGNFLTQLPGIMFLIDTIIMLAGLFLLGNGLRLFVVASDNSQRSALMRQGSTSVWMVPVMSCIVGVLLYNRYLTASMMLSSFYGSGVTPDSLMDYPGGGVNNEFDSLIQLVSIIMKAFGYIVFFLGWWGLRQPEEPGSFKVNASKIIFGIFLINNIATINGLGQLFGFGEII